MALLLRTGDTVKLTWTTVFWHGRTGDELDLPSFVQKPGVMCQVAGVRKTEKYRELLLRHDERKDARGTSVPSWAWVCDAGAAVAV